MNHDYGQRSGGVVIVEAEQEYRSSIASLIMNQHKCIVKIIFMDEGIKGSIVHPFIIKEGRIGLLGEAQSIGLPDNKIIG